MSLFNIGLSGLNSAAAGMSVTGQNINGMNVAGYTRKDIIQQTLYPQSAGYGYPGNGVQVTDVRRVYDGFLNKQVQTATAASNYYSSKLSYLNQLDSTLANSSTGVSSQLQTFFSAIQTLATDPNSVPSRQAMLDQASSMVNSFKAANDRIEELRNGVNTEVKSSVTQINALAKQIASLNQQISQLWQGDTQQPLDLIDQRDQAITELNKYVKASSVPSDSGKVNVFIGSGQSMVLGGTPFELQVMPGSGKDLQIGYKDGSPLPSDLLTGGSLGGALSVRKTLVQSQEELGATALGMAINFNNQQKAGLDKNGAQGTDMFTLNFNFPPWSAATPAANAALLDSYSKTFANGGMDDATRSAFESDAINALSLAITQPDKIAAASPLKATGTTGAATVSATSISRATAQDNTLADDLMAGTASLTINYTATGLSISAPAAYSGYTVVARPGVTGGYKIMSNGTPPEETGVNLTMNGTLAGGGTFQLGKNTSFTEKADNSNLLEFTNLQTANLVQGTNGSATGTMTLQGALGQTVTSVGSITNETKVMNDAQTNSLKQVTLARESVSGVNLDEETINLLKYQQAYQASGKVIQTAGTLFDTILNAVGG